MKKLLLSFTIMASWTINAQSILLGDTLSTGDMFQYYQVDSATASQASITGNSAGTVWDFSNIILVDDSGQFDTEVIDIANSSFSADFPSAKYHENFNSGVQSFFVNETDKVITHGFVFSSGGSDYIIKYNVDSLEGLTFPIAYGNSTSDIISGEAVVPFFGSVAIAGTADMTVDGLGELKLPGNNYSNTLRVKTIENLSGSTILGQAEITRTTYAYYHTATSKFPLFIYGDIVLTVQNNGTIYLKMVWSKDANPNYVAIEDSNSELIKVNIYPNPASESVLVDVNKSGTKIEILNTIGKVVFTKASSSLKNNLDVSSLSSGVYFIRITEGNSMFTKKLIIK